MPSAVHHAFAYAGHIHRVCLCHGPEYKRRTSVQNCTLEMIQRKKKSNREKEKTECPLLQVSAGHEMDGHKHMDFGAPNHTVKRHIAVVAI